MYRHLIGLLSLFPVLVFGQIQSMRHLPHPPLTLPVSLSAGAPMQRTADNGFMVCYNYGFPTLDAGAPLHGELVKLDSNLVPQWRASLPGENGREIFSFADGSTLLPVQAGVVGLVKMGDQGNLLWSKSYSRPYPLGISQRDGSLRSGNRLLIGGGIHKVDGFGFWQYSSGALVELDTSGTILRADSISVPNLANTFVDVVAVDNLDRIFLAGSGFASGGLSYIAVLNPNTTPLTVWEMNTAGYTPSFTAALAHSTNSGFIAGTVYDPLVGTGTVILLHVSNTGSMTWQVQLGQASAVHDLVELPNGNILATGILRNTTSGVNTEFAMEVDFATGAVVRSYEFDEGLGIGGPYFRGPNDWIWAAYGAEPVIFTTDSTGARSCGQNILTLTTHPLAAVLTSTTMSINSLNLSLGGLAAIQSDPQPTYDTCAAVVVGVEDAFMSSEIEIWPNPSLGNLHVRTVQPMELLRVWNALGQLVETRYVGATEVALEMSAPGVYWVEVEAAGQILRERLVVSR